MIDARYVQTMARYNAWQNGQLKRIFAGMEAAALMQDRGAFFGSILGTANHVLWGDRVWMHRFAGHDKPPGGIAESVGLTDLRESWESERCRTDAAILLWADRLDAPDLDGPLRWRSGALGRDVSRPLALCVAHMFNHQTHHRGQIHAMLTATGGAAPVSDLSRFPTTGPGRDAGTALPLRGSPRPPSRPALPRGGRTGCRGAKGVFEKRRRPGSRVAGKGVSQMIRALVVRKDEETGKTSAAVEEIAETDLPAGEVTVAVEYSTLNYKDGLCIGPGGGLVRQYPHVPGIDFAGTVEASEDARYTPGDKVVLTGWRVGEAHWGGHAQKARVKADWLVPLPEGLTHAAGHGRRHGRLHRDARRHGAGGSRA